METLYLLIPVSVLLVFFIGWAFWWSVRSGQFDDLEGPAYRMLMDDEKNDAARAASPAVVPAVVARAQEGAPAEITPSPAEHARQEQATGAAGQGADAIRVLDI